MQEPSHYSGLGIISLPFARKEIDGYKVPSKYNTNFSLSVLHWVKLLVEGTTNFRLALGYCLLHLYFANTLDLGLYPTCK